MSQPSDTLESLASVRRLPSRLGVVVHPNRNIDGPLQALREWAATSGVDLVQIRVTGQHRHVAEPGNTADCDLIVAIGGDGTTLAAIRAAASADRPVLGAACGSLGVLTSVEGGALADALDRFSRGDWEPRMLPALHATRDAGESLVAFNDIVIVRAGQGQVRVTARLDGVLYARSAGDGCIVSTPTGSSAYAFAAGGPLMAPGSDGFLLTRLPTHGGVCPPLVAGPSSELQLDATTGYGGARLEVDGQVTETNMQIASLTIRMRPGAATMVGFADQEPMLLGLRRLGIIVDSPRIVADDSPR